MATISANVFTLLDYARQIDPTGKLVGYQQMVNNITQANEALDDVLWMPCNNGARHLTTKLTSQPAGKARRLNQGVPKSKYTTEQVDVGCAMFDDFYEIDCKLAELNNNSATWRANAEAAFDAGMSETITKKLFYGNVKVAPEEFDGFATIYGKLNDPYFQVLSAAGATAGQNTSVYLLGWGSETMHGLFPNGSKAGLQKEDLGRQVARDADGNEFMVLKSHFMWDAGLVVRNPLFGVRIANIDVPALLTAGDASDTSANLLKLMTVATTKVKSLAGARFAWYCNNTVMAMLLVKLMNKAVNTLTIGDYENRQNVVKYMNIPVRKCDLILSTEDPVS